MIVNIWFIIGTVLIPLSFFTRSKLAIVVSSVIFFAFGCIAGTRDSEFNSDTINYLRYFQYAAASQNNLTDLLAFFSDLRYEIIFSILTAVTAVFDKEDYFLFFMSAIPSAIFSYVFIKYNYQPIMVSHIFVTMSYVGATTSLRHYLALSILWWVSSYILQHRKKKALVVLPGLTHYAAMAISPFLLLSKSHFRFGVIFFVISTISILFYIDANTITSSFNEAVDREEAVGSTGARVFVNYALAAILIFNNKGAIQIKENLPLAALLLVNSIIFAYPAFGRITSFITIMILARINYSRNLDNFSIGFIFLFIINLSALIYFYNHSY